VLNVWREDKCVNCLVGRICRKEIIKKTKLQMIGYDNMNLEEAGWES
jgi:hypothetical protein